MTDQEKLKFIIDTELKIINAIFKGHKSADNDEFSKDRTLVKQYRRELGLIKDKELKK